MNHLTKFHKHDKLVDTSLGTFQIKPATATADEDAGEVVDDEPSPALSPAAAAGLGIATAPEAGFQLLSASGNDVEAMGDEAEPASSPAPAAGQGVVPASEYEAQLLAELAELDEAEVAYKALVDADPQFEAYQAFVDSLASASPHVALPQVALAQAAPANPAPAVQAAPAMVPGFEGDYVISDSDYASPTPQPPRKKRKSKKSKVEKEHKYASLKELEDEELRRQLERRQQGFTSDLTVSRHSGGLPQPEEAELLDEREQQELFVKQVKEKDVEKITGVFTGRKDKKLPTKKTVEKEKKEAKTSKEASTRGEEPVALSQLATDRDRRVDQEAGDVTLVDGEEKGEGRSTDRRRRRMP